MSGRDTAHLDTPPTAPAERRATSGGRRRLTLPRLALTMVLLLAGFFVVRKYVPFFVDDGFIAFEPDVSMFPPAPVTDARTDAGIGRPIGWPGTRFSCRYNATTDPSPYASAIGGDWHTVRHDWTEAGSEKAWIIGEKTDGFTSLRRYDDFVQEFRDLIEYCGSTYDAVGFNSISTELPGLPDDGFAFTIGLSPDAAAGPSFGESDPANFSALGALLPGRKRGQVMYVLWVAWGTDVPRDQFVSVANSLYEDAHNATKDDHVSGGDRTIEYQFHEFDPEAAGILPLVGDDAEAERRLVALSSRLCGQSFPPDGVWGSSSASRDEAWSRVEYESGDVMFGASRWEKRSKYLEAKQRILNAGAARCIGSYRNPSLLIEPIDVPGLPEGTVVSRWDQRGELLDDAYTATLTDDDKQLLMTVVWRPDSGAAPADEFVAVVNRAWDQFRADNP